METFEIKGEIILLNQLLKALNWCESGAQANATIEEGLVKVNGKKELRKRNKLPKGTIVEFDGNKVKLV
jgi:ribosome-associated protein